jgi:hypothetical protein
MRPAICLVDVFIRRADCLSRAANRIVVGVVLSATLVAVRDVFRVARQVIRITVVR